jgi:D-glycero-D-manno-heptose 1,7-bisphosphate phosphatase
MRPAVFLDRDGTIIRNVRHLADPRGVELLRGAADAIARLRHAGYPCVVISNQSAVARGLLTLEGLDLVHQEFCRQLAEAGTAIDGWYFCPEGPVSGDRTAIEHPDRKPAPGMLIRAAADLGLDLSRSWMVGDMLSDMLAGRNAGCRGSILVRTGEPEELAAAERYADYVVDDLPAAASWILSQTGSTAAPQSFAHRDSSLRKGTPSP